MSMNKQQEFLFIVQTAMLSNNINLSLAPAEASKYRHVMSPGGIIGTAADALWASGRIPADMTAQEAAADFCGYMLENMRDQAAEAQDPVELPSWFARG